jgi:hypothetical protein
MEAIQGETNFSTTECGHTFHFQCLYRWHRKHTTCPLCRKDFGGFEEDTDQRVADYTYRTLQMLIMSASVGISHVGPRSSRAGWSTTAGRGGAPHRPPLPQGAVHHVAGPVSASRLDLHQIATRHHAEVPLEEFTGEIEQRDIDLVAGQAGVDHSIAQTYLRYYHGDIVDAILCLTEHADLPIPPFRRRIRPTEPYETRTVRERLVKSRRKEAKSGYESC